MTDPLHQQAVDPEDGEPLWNPDGSPHTWFDLLAGVAQLAEADGQELVCGDDGKFMIRGKERP